MLKCHPRYSLRSLLVVVTIVAIGCWLYARSREFDRRAIVHAEESRLIRWNAYWEYKNTIWSVHTAAETDRQPAAAERERLHQLGETLAAYHRLLSKKYLSASKYPWLPVEADPQPPQ